MVVGDEEEGDVQTLWPLVEKALDQAVDRCCQMRSDEGKALEQDLVSRLKRVGETVASVDKLAPDVSKRHAEAFRKRIEQLVGETSVDEDRLTNEIALMADRLDVTYLLQEMHREASTIGAKASDSEVMQLVVTLKEESEKLREQVQNLE